MTIEVEKNNILLFISGSSGAGSARGSVKSISQQHSRTATQDATLDVSDIQVGKGNNMPYFPYNFP